MTSDNSESRQPPSADDWHSRCTFSGSVHVVNLQRASLSRKFDKVQCLLARDDTASVNLYVDYRRELDFMTFRLTHGIRQVYINKKACSVKIHLSNQQRLDVTLDSEDLCQSFYDLVARVKEKPNDSDSFPRHQPKMDIEQRPDPNSAYLTAKDTPTGLARSTAAATVLPTVPSTPIKRKMATLRPTMVLEQTNKKTCKDLPAGSAFNTYRQSAESRGSMLSDSPLSSEPTPDRWRFPSSPIYLDDEAMTPSKSTSLTQAIGQFEKFGRVDSLASTPLQRPQFHAIVPTPRVLRSMRSTTKRYGCEVESRKSKNALVQDRTNGSRCIGAVLQALFCLDPVSKLLQEPSSWIRLSGSQHGIFRSLVDSYAHRVQHNTLAVDDEVVSHSVTKNARGSLGDDQDDAREFLKDCLGQLRREFQGRNVETRCPVSKVFECQVEDIVVCVGCGNQTIRTEHYQDFCLEVPMVHPPSQQTMSLGSLVPQVFDTRQTAQACEVCLAEEATVHRAISKLPTVLVLSLKRFSSKPTQGYHKNRALVAIDETLEFTQFCSPEAFTAAHTTGSTHGLCSDDELLNDHPHIPSDSFPSSSSSRFSSASPGRLDPFWNFSPSLPPRLEDDYIDLDRYDPLQLNSAADPIILISDDEDQTVTPANESFSFFEEPSEEEQYRWAIEESLRASQTSSQEFVPDREEDGGTTQVSSRIFDPSDPAVKEIRFKSAGEPFNPRETTHSSYTPAPDAIPLLHKTTSTHDTLSTTLPPLGSNRNGRRTPMNEFGNKKDEEKEEEDEDEDEDGEEDEDESLKAAIRASLMGSNHRPPTEEELQEQESKQVQEAIDKSLKDQEDNKENISPEHKRGEKKKGKKDASTSTTTTMIAGLTRSCTQSRIPEGMMDSTPKDGGRVTRPAQLRRANTVEVNGRMRPHPGSAVDLSSSRTHSSSQPIPPRRPTRSSSFMRTSTENMNGGSKGVIEEQQSCSRPSRSFVDSSAPSIATADNDPSTRPSRAAKGKDKAPKKTGVYTVADDRLGLFRLQATVSHTGLVSTTTTSSEGYYVCDRRGADGIWRCQDGTRRTKIGSISDLNKHRGRSGYLFFYVRCRVEDAVAL